MDGFGGETQTRGEGEAAPDVFKWYQGCINLCSRQLILHALLQAGMIKTEQEEFYIEPVERGAGVIEAEEEEGGGRTHVVYRSSAVRKAPVSSAAADFHSRGQFVALSVPVSQDSLLQLPFPEKLGHFVIVVQYLPVGGVTYYSSFQSSKVVVLIGENGRNIELKEFC